MSKMIQILLLVMCLVATITGHRDHGMQSVLKEDLELERQLNILNKPPIKSIHTMSGYIVDCVDINKQPAFDHPLLKNHKLQKKPIFERNINEIRVQNLPIKSISIFEKVRCQSSAGHLYFKRGKEDDIDKISVGWHVFPELYNDNQTHLYLFWTSGKNGCFNMLCKGFIQVDRSYIFGARVSKTSTYGGEIMEVALQISKDNVGNWWLKVLNKDIGYFPAALFSSLKGADQVEFGGYTVTPAGTDSPTMGSGHKPDGDFTHASYFRFVKHLNIVQEPDDPLPFMVEIDNDAPNCYGVTNYEGKKRHMGYSLQFGGPGGKC
ncbi:unnamed protein product [Vicia faba]|uniref:Neprosin PEP catalytic domain-containing protein n=1 Tax=Vicia faba TaxID=3906 RepID=A0AAV0YFA8_VICFA|nr:unnamed protein product [Vicia faba]